MVVFVYKLPFSIRETVFNKFELLKKNCVQRGRIIEEFNSINFFDSFFLIV